MRTSNRLSLFALSAALAAAAPGCGRASPLDSGNPPAIGSKAPDFVLNSQEGHPVGLHDFRGKWVVLYFYPKDFTKGCTIEAHGFQADLPKYESVHAVILGVSVQSAQSHKAFCAKEGMSFRLLSDATRGVSSSYGSLMNMGLMKFSKRRTFLIDPAGVIRKEFLDVKPAAHSREVLAALAELQSAAAAQKASASSSK